MTALRSRVGLFLFIFAALCGVSTAAKAAPAEKDSDGDGLSDQLEQRLLVQFLPKFMIGGGDCAGSPAEFRTGIPMPEALKGNGTIYGQAFPVKAVSGKPDLNESYAVEIHFYHLWDRDCGLHGHMLDTEHVAVLVRLIGDDRTIGNNPEMVTWKALYWYAAAHENTVCDVSQIARASSLHAENRGATVFVSPGKHASYLSEKLCTAGCGADRCEAMIPLQTRAVINLGEPGRPMNGSDFASSVAWPLQAKMSATDFPQEALSRLNQTPENEIVWFRAGKHPVQGTIATSLATGEAIAGSESNTVDAVNKAGESTGSALSNTTESTGNALQKSYRNTAHAIGSAVRHTGRALSPKPVKDKPSEGQPK